MSRRAIPRALPALATALLVLFGATGTPARPPANAAGPQPATTAVQPAAPARVAGLAKASQEASQHSVSRSHRALRALSISARGIGRPAVATTTATATGSRGADVVLSSGLNQAGLSIADDRAFGFQEAPPDPTGAIGPNYYVETVNSVIGVYSRTDLSLVGKASFDSWLNSSKSLCDPQIQWDAASGRWLFVVLQCGSSDHGFYFGWSKTTDPSTLSTAGWCVFTENPGSTVLPDYPKLGHNAGYMIVGANEFNNSTLNFISAAIFWMATPAPGSLSSCTAPTVQTLGSSASPLLEGDGLTPAATPVPVNNMTTAPDGYIFSAYDPSGPPATPQNLLGVWHLSSAGVLTPEPDIIVNTYAVPNAAPAGPGGNSSGIDTLDGRLTMAVGDPTLGMYTQHTVNGPGGRSVMEWFELTVSAPGGAPALAQEGTISSTTDYVFNGAIAPRLDGKGAAVFYNRSSSTLNPVIAGQIRLATTAAGAMEPGEITLGTSQGPDADFTCNYQNLGYPCRWGDYSGASPDPNNPAVVWGTNQALGTVFGINPTWTTRNWAVLVAVAPHAPTGVTAVAGDRSPTVSWTPSTFDAGTPDTGYIVTAYIGSTPVAQETVGAGITSTAFGGLSCNTTYTFTVAATNLVGTGPESNHSNPVTRCAISGGSPAPSPSPSRSPVSQVSPAPSPTSR